MSLLKSNSVQIGQSATATQNFTLSVPSSPDGTIKLARGNSGATTADILSVSSSGAVTINNLNNLNNQSFRNRIINGDMRIDQRSSGAAYAITTGATYGSCDRWGSLAGANGVWTQFRTATTLTDLPFAMRVQRTAGSTSTTAVYVGQVIETTDCADLAGQSVTLSFYATAGANFSAPASQIAVILDTGTGSDQGWASLNAGTWTTFAAVLNTTQTITTTRTRYSFTTTIPAGTNEVAVRFGTTGTGTAGASDFFQILGVQLEAGSTVTDFERMPIGTQLELCQRYFEKVFFAESRYGIDGIITRIPAYYKVDKRATPTIALITAPDILFYSPSNSIDTYSAAALGGVASTLGCRFTYTIRGTRLYAFGVTQPAIYGCDSEL